MNSDSNNTTPTSSRPPAPQKRGKIQIRRIIDNRTRQVTFLKRKNGLLKKAMELGILCDCEVAVIVYNPHNGKLFEYSSIPMERVLNRYATYSGPTERRKTEQFFDVAAARANSNIPVNEPTVAMAAQNASLAASRRPRPTYKFEEELDPHGVAKRRKLSSGETPTFEVPTNGIQIPQIVNGGVTGAVTPIPSVANTTFNMVATSPIHAAPLTQPVQVPHPLPVIPDQDPSYSYAPGLMPQHQTNYNTYGTAPITQPMYTTTYSIPQLHNSVRRDDRNPNILHPHSHPSDNGLYQTSGGQVSVEALTSIPNPAYPQAIQYGYQRQAEELTTGTNSVMATSVQMNHPNHYTEAQTYVENQQQRVEEPPADTIPPVQLTQHAPHTEGQPCLDKQKETVAEGEEVKNGTEIRDLPAESPSVENGSKLADGAAPIRAVVADAGPVDAPHTETQKEPLQSKQAPEVNAAPRESVTLKPPHASPKEAELSNKENEGTENLPLPRIDIRSGAIPHTSSDGTIPTTTRGCPPPIPHSSETAGDIPRLQIPPTPHGQSTWPALNSLSSSDGGNSVSLTRFFGLDSSSARRRNPNPFAMPQDGMIPLTPRFFGLDTSSSARSLFHNSNDAPFVRGSPDDAHKQDDDKEQHKTG